MLKIAFSPLYCLSLPDGHRFPMVKYDLIPKQLLYQGYIQKENLFEPDYIDRDTAALTHCEKYWERLMHLEITPKEMRKIGFPLSEELIKRELNICAGTISCCEYAFEYGVSMNVAGGTHHAFYDRGEGFCVLNDMAIAANYLLHRNKANKILIVDLDVHQGNGTASLFQAEQRVFTFSMHGASNYPLHKEKSDLDIDLPDLIGDSDYLKLLHQSLTKLFNDIKPDFVFYLSGVDVLAGDKLGRLGLSMEGCKKRDEMVFEFCKKHSVPVCVAMGGGYSPSIADIVNAHCNTFIAASEIIL